MKPATPMTSPFHHPIDTARRAVSRERARPEPRKTRHSRQTRPGGRPAPPNPRHPAHPVRRTAVRFASRPPQTCLKRPATSTRVRKRLILNRKFKAQTASKLRP